MEVLEKIDLRLGDCLEVMRSLPDNSVDSVVTDPPYGLSFMGKKWDYQVPGSDIWREVFRVLKPGGHLLSFGGTRTYHRLVIEIEEAGFEIRDMIQWIYGSGFPKSTDVSKRIDKEAGAEREVVGVDPNKVGRKTNAACHGGMEGSYGVDITPRDPYIRAPSTPEAIQWQGWGTALKPANEPICVARKPLEKDLTVAANVLKWGTGALNIDGSRIEGRERTEYGLKNSKRNNSNTFGADGTSADFDSSKGRWPANVLFDEEAAAMLDEQSGTLKNGGGNSSSADVEGMFGTRKSGNTKFANDSGGASRFFYCAKASKSERGQGNIHPTIKPKKLGLYLQNLVTPPGGVILDPFMGSGSFGVSAKLGGFSFIGIEREPDYFEIAKRRIESAAPEVKEPEPQLEFPA